VPDEDIRALIDHRAFHQVMLNLLINSADAVQECKEPCITITIGQINTNRVQVCVADNGCGMSEAERDNIFRPFFTSKPHKTGLGLVIIKKLLARMDCGIGVSSNPGKGTTVTMNLPLGSMTNESN
jgi:signal transduction histidine kinase